MEVTSNVEYTNRISDDTSLSSLPSKALSAILVITYSKEVLLSSLLSSFTIIIIIIITYQFTIQCYDIIISKENTIIQKLIAMIRLLNNLMNMEQFFYLDLIITLFLSLYSFFITRDVANNSQFQYQNINTINAQYYYDNYPYMPPGISFYFYGNLIVNSYFLWYFSYCRFLNGKDVITLRRSIQFLSHCFQLSSVGLLVLCKERHNYIRDWEPVGYNCPVDYNNENGCEVLYGSVTFICSANILATYTFRVLWHTTILIKTVLDECLSSFIISRGTIIDLLMIFFIPIGSTFSYITNYHAHGFMKDMMKLLSVTYEMNDISRNTKYYNQLTDSYHSKSINILIFFTTIQWVVYSILVFTTLSSFLSLSCVLLMIEYFLCGKNKYGTMVTVFIINIAIAISLYYHNYNYNITDPYYSIQLIGVENKKFLFYFLAIFVLLLVLVVCQNRSHASLYSMPLIVVKSLFLFLYVLVYCPLQPMFSFICSYSRTSNSAEESITSDTTLDINPIVKESDVKDKTEIDTSSVTDNGRSNHLKDTARNNAIVIAKVPVLIFFSPFVDYYWENVEAELQISYPRYVASIIARYSKFTVSHHQSHYNTIIWIESVMAIFSILYVDEIMRFDVEYIETHTASPTLSPTYSPTYTIDSPTPIPTVGPTLYPTYSPREYNMNGEIDYENKVKRVFALNLGILY